MAGKRRPEEFCQLRHFIWDFDGTLFDTYPVIIRNFRDALAQFGYDADPSDVMKLMLDQAAAAMSYYARKFGIPQERLERVYDGYRQQSNRNLEACPMEGVREVLQHICETGKYNYVFTHRPIAQVRAYFRKYGMEPFFRDIVGPETPGFIRKPAPDGINCLRLRYEMKAEQTVMVGDRRLDMDSGRSAGIRTAHLVCRTVPQDLECDWQLRNCAAMSAMLD